MLQTNALAALVMAYLGAGLATGLWTWPEVWVKLADPEHFMTLARGLSFAFGAGAIVGTYVLGRQVLDRRAGLLAALLLALTPTFNHYCHDAVPDAALACMAAWACIGVFAPCPPGPPKLGYRFNLVRSFDAILFGPTRYVVLPR